MTNIKTQDDNEYEKYLKRESKEKRKMSKAEENDENEEKINYMPPHPKIYYSCYLFNEELDYKPNNKNDVNSFTYKLNTQKAFVISSFYQFHTEFFEILKGIKKCVQSLAGLEFEKIIHSLVFDIPSPCPGMTKVKYNYSQFIEFEFELNPINKIPQAGSDLKVIFDILGIRNVLDIVKYVILEVPVIIFGLDKYILANAVKSLEEFLFPFSYPYPVIEILPKVYYKSLEKLSCYIVGINQKYSNDFFELNNIKLSDRNYIIVTLSEHEPGYTYVRRTNDKYSIILKDYNKLVRKEGEDKQNIINLIKDTTNFPKHYLSKLMKNLNQLFHDKNGIKNNINDIQNDDIRFKFYYFFISMFQHYKYFLINDKKSLIDLYSKVENDTVELNDLFKFQDFIVRADDSFEFFNYFMVTRIWKNFLIKNLYPKTLEDKLEVLLMDESIIRKKNKNMIKQLFKENTPFLETNVFDVTKSELINISDSNELTYNNSTQNDSDEKNLLLDNEKLILLYQFFLESDQNVRNLYEDFYYKCQIILKERRFSEKISNIGYNINLNKDLKPNNEYYIVKLRFLLICYVFKSLDRGEKWPIFSELLKEIQNIPNLESKKSIVDSFLANLMFTTFIKYGDKNMCSLLYKELSIIPCVREDYLIFTQLHKKFINRKEEFKLSLPKETLLKERNYNILGTQDNKLGMKLILISGCKNCNLTRDMIPEMTNYSEMKDNEITYQCKICHATIIAKFSLSLPNNPSKTKTYTAYTPKALFNYIKNIGDFNVDTFYKEHKTVFYNLLILFQLRGQNYSFLFPYKEKKNIGFNPSTLDIAKTDDNKYIKKKVNLSMNKWYEKCDFPENRYRMQRFSKLLTSRKAAGAFKTFEDLNPTAFFQKDFSKKDKKKFNTSLMRAKTINED